MQEIVQQARSQQIACIARGVHDAGTMTALFTSGVEYMQGDFIAPISERRSSASAATRSDQPSPVSAASTLSLTPPAAIGAATVRVVGGASLPASETVMSFAVFGPMPLTLRNTASSSLCTASATCSAFSRLPWRT